MAAAFDTYVHAYPLAATDTTETVSEFNAVVTLAAALGRRARHDWSLRADVAAGTELTRQRLEAGYAWRPDERVPRLRRTPTC